MAKEKLDFKYKTESIGNLKAHPRNYRTHPDDQLEHIIQSIKDHGIYRNIVVAKDNTILAGHGVVLACLKMKIEQVPIIQLGIDANSPQALKVLTGDNEISHLGEVDDRALSEILKDIKDQANLFGTGFDDMMLENLVMVTRPGDEIKDFNAALHWTGLPEHTMVNETSIRLFITFPDEETRLQFLTKFKIKVDIARGLAWSTRWPWEERQDTRNIAFENNGQ